MNSVLSVISLFNRHTATPFALKANALITRGDYAALTSLHVDPQSYDNPFEYLRDAQVSALVRKLPGLPTGINLRAAALKAFFEAERQCAVSNNRLAPFVNARERGPHFENPQDWEIYDFTCRVRKRIGDLLGSPPSSLDGKFGNGATYGDRGQKITICHKMASHPTVTERAACFLDLIRETSWYRATSNGHRVVRGNRFTTVPKDSEKDRGIAVEPSINVFFQLAVGAHLRERLYSAGIRIDGKSKDNAQCIHRRLAQLGSLSGDLATIDLKSASDTVCYNLVKLLLPKGWFELLASLRSEETEVDGVWVKNQKFSSMGNGYTFELETLIFWGITSELNAGHSKVYGDDIIVDTTSFNDIIWALRFFGFTANERKSFATGPFRESCGGDYFTGVDVRPVFLKTMPSNPYEWITLHNLIMQAADKVALSDEAKGELTLAIVSNLPTWARLYGPKTVAGVLHVEDRSKWRTDFSHGIRRVRGLVPLPRRFKLESFGPGPHLASALLGAPSEGVPMRDSVTGWKRKWVPAEFA